MVKKYTKYTKLTKKVINRMGFGIPIVNFICFFFSYRDLKGHGMSTWDQKIGTVILYGKVSMSRLFIAGSFPMGLLAAGFYL
jgi:hypothetical protein